MDEPSALSIARLWAHGPNAEKIRRVVARLHALTPQESELLLFGMDIEEGILPRSTPAGGRPVERFTQTYGSSP